jgi:hypothetical protein
LDEVNALAAGKTRAESRPLAYLLIAAGFVTLVANTLTFGGDPEIHLIFAQNLLEGFPLQFNRGSFSSGETSPIYMVLVSLFVLLAGLGGAAVAMKIVGLASAAAIVVLLYRNEVVPRQNKPQRLLLVVALWAMPSFLFQAQLGMENMLFTLCVLLVLRKLLSTELDERSFLFCAFFAHALFFLRPEAVFLVVCCYALLWCGSTPFPGKAQTFYLFGMSSFVVATVILVEHITAVPLHGAGEMRALLSPLQETWSLWPSKYISLQPLKFALYAWPLLILVVLEWRVMSKRWQITLCCLVLTPLALHFINVFPNTHFSRYVLYLWGPLMLCAMWCASNARFRLSAYMPLVFAANVIIVAPTEVYARVQTGSFANTGLLSTFSISQASIKTLSDELCSSLMCGSTPKVIATQEVQIRLRLDERFVVRSLDGVVDADLRAYVKDGFVDHLRYLEHRGVDAVLQAQTYGRVEPTSLATIDQKAASGTVSVGCSIFDRAAFRDEYMLVRRAKPCDPR